MRFLKFLKTRYFISGLRLMYWKLRYPTKISLQSMGVFIDAGVNIDIDTGKLLLAHKSSLGRHTQIIIRNNASVTIDKGTYIGDMVRIAAFERIRIGSECLIADSVALFDHDHRFDRTDIPISKQGHITRPITIGDNVWIGSHCVICKGVTIGSNAIIGAGAVVTRDIEENAIYAGVPARLVKMRQPPPLSPRNVP